MSSYPEEGLEDTETDHDNSSQSEERYKYSSGTTIEASDSTFTTDSTYNPEESHENEVTTNDTVHNDEDIATVDESEIDSDDFTFNLANVYEASAENPEDDYQNVDIEESISDLDVPILELCGAHHDDTSSSTSVQLFNIGETYEKAIRYVHSNVGSERNETFWEESCGSDVQRIETV